MPTTSVEMPDALKDRIEAKVEAGEYTSNSDLIRYAVRRLLDPERLDQDSVEELNERLKYTEEELVDLEEV